MNYNFILGRGARCGVPAFFSGFHFVLLMTSKDLPAERVTALLRGIKAGSEHAVRELYLYYRPALFAFIRFRIRDDVAAEEIVDDAFMIALRNLERFDGTSMFKTWLFGIARNCCGTWIRHQQTAMVQATVQMDDGELEAIPDPDASVLGFLESAELNEILRECIDQLPIAQREVLFWTWFEEEPLEIVAVRVECPLGTVKSRLFHARRRVGDCVQKATHHELAHA